MLYAMLSLSKFSATSPTFHFAPGVGLGVGAGVGDGVGLGAGPGVGLAGAWVGAPFGAGVGHRVPFLYALEIH